MRDLPQSSDERLVVGTEGFSDAGVFRLSSDHLLVQSLDFFAPLVDDPYQFGQIAAANSLSDIFASGAAPTTALNIVCFPDNKLGLDVLTDILRGGTDKVHEAGAVLVGGHSIRDDEIKYGLSVTGIVSEDRLKTNQGAQPGDVLVLTKRLGTGFITTAMKKNKCPEEVAQAAITSMACLNKRASEASVELGAHAITDITGFGLGIHACELAESSGVTLQIDGERLPVLPGAIELARQGFYTRANESNQKFLESKIKVAEGLDPMQLALIYDPQTSGGLLISVPEGKGDALVRRINESESEVATLVGKVLPYADHRVVVE